MKRTTVFALLMVLTLAGACRNHEAQRAASSQPAAQPQAVATTATLTPEQLGELGAQIRKDPARADELLSQRGLTAQSFEKQIRDVTENPDASKRYAEAYRKGSA